MNKLLLILEAQPERGYTVPCPTLPELITEGDSVREVLDNAADALAAMVEAFEDLGCPASTLEALRTSEFFGMWRDRTDLPDSSELAREWRDPA